jgi:hypothetical protein
MQSGIVVLRTAGALAVLGAWWAGARQAEDQRAGAVRLSAGTHSFAWDERWPLADALQALGATHGGLAVDSKGRVLCSTDTERAVLILSDGGELLGSWGKDLAGGLHGLTLAREGEREVLYLAHTARHEVLVATLEGEILRTLDWPQASGLYAGREEFAPTGVAVAPDGRIFVADGYGKSYVHLYSADGRWQKAIGGPGTEPGQFRTPHGLIVDRRGSTPTLLVADRENARLQRFSLEGELLGVVAGDFRRPCGAAQHGQLLAVPDLAGRVSLLDGQDRLIAHLGDNPDAALRANHAAPRERWRAGEFLAPHAACFDAQGNLYVQDWLALGRVTKLARIDGPAAETPPAPAKQ